MASCGHAMIPMAELLWRLCSPTSARSGPRSTSTRVPGDDPPTEDRDKARNFLPPPLLREGERVQPEWLYRFLLHPQPIRSYTILRMPRFNMSAEEARALVDYFNGVSRLENPSANLPRTYADLPQRDPAFWESQNSTYLRRLKEKNVLDGRVADLKPGWKLVWEERRSAMDRQIELMKGIVEVEQKPALLALHQARTAGTNAVAALVLGRSDLTPTAAAWTSLLEAEKALKPAEEAFKKVQESDNLVAPGQPGEAPQGTDVGGGGQRN